ncbi:hypothetical protein [Paracoccus sp. (in: a-proteobacteria)]|uniref:hypothetical protein n=1 Tax=Paracoccus sp. TaxID=267 RepID=UPI003A8C51DE
MKTLRALFLAILVIAVLPWGAFASGHASWAAASTQLADTLQSGGSHGEKPSLAGNSCHVDHAILPVLVMPARDALGAAIRPSDGPARCGLPVAGAPEPPRP